MLRGIGVRRLMANQGCMPFLCTFLIQGSQVIKVEGKLVNKLTIYVLTHVWLLA